ncbi:hypothetical protein HN51_060632 [Arachis hypogaea]|uniref:DCD domain-containing protein n=1 Tax=Arachis hypogaea TaxID=3818 RepID=A0A444XAE0_ARAHY|nr:uncharacterized protein LOC107622403 [Arachis ipaensis]XP_025680790.1 uncharacterized protein LOC112782562 [Arachis hypogaea]XP_025680791.1 uncharacterized protein LOC112782562 [Arachis hypogaea]XP_025680792.1 uncharacterized protein LOC112782562 [Arachis hypogaea]XP_025680793.1 uncharacterized protein LOC112782562 [Arachis hypogaea]XP_029152016.1 uncharacterized protein LOC112782562 [Arachis hypogaea]XP_029152017.1 uncharacterized protein LOC112782562 [Arachis hypogaea]QHO04731.1 B2 prot
MEQEDSKGTENSLEVPSNPQSSEKDSPPEGSNKSETDGSNKPETEGYNKPETEGSGKLEPDGSGQLVTEGSGQLVTEGSSQPELQGSNAPEPKGSSQGELGKKKTKRVLKVKRIRKKSANTAKVKANGNKSLQNDGKNKTVPVEGSDKPNAEGSTKLELDGASQQDPQGSSQQDPQGSRQQDPQGSIQPEPSDKNTPRSLKAKAKIVKKSKNVKENGLQQIHGKDRKWKKNKKVVGKTDEQPKGKNLEVEKSEEKESPNKRTSDKGPIEKKHEAERSKIVESNKSEPKQNNKEKHRGPDKGSKSRANKDKHGGMENTRSSEKKREKLGGVIFMCSGKTKPDCFRYSVMGVPAGKKDVVLGVKPGMKLFLYDFDLKLLYGIYKASSSGGMKLEPRAFGGNFPAQVRFTVSRDCFPLPENIFRKAIKENYNEKNKFKTELTIRQVRKLTELFRSVEAHSTLQPVRSPPKARIRDVDDRDVGRVYHRHRESAAGDPYTISNMNRYNVLPHERDSRVERREEIPRDLFLTEKSYRAYGLQGDVRSVASASLVNPILEPPYKRDYERDHLHPDPIYIENVPSRVEDPYFRSAISDRKEDPYYAYRYGGSPRDPYLPPLGREDIPRSSYVVGGRTLIGTGTDDLQRRETVHDRHYSTYSAADALSEYDRMQQYRRENLESASVPVSSRYSFAGTSYSLR